MKKHQRRQACIWTPAEQQERVVYFSDYFQREERRQPLLVWESTQGPVPRWLDVVSDWVEVAATLVMTVCSVYWIWYCMCCV